MKRSEVRVFLEDGVNLLAPACNFRTGRLSEFNSERDKTYPYAWLYELEVSTSLSNGRSVDTWSCTIRIAKLDTADSLPDQYEAIVDDCDYIAQQLIKYYDQDLDDSVLVLLSGITRPPFVKEHADCTTGVDLKFTLEITDKTTICG